MNQYHIHVFCPFSKKKQKEQKKQKQKSSFDRQRANIHPLWVGTGLEALCRLSGARKLHKSMN